MDISDFYQTFFDEADELLADMEQHLLDLVPEWPEAEQLNAIFRAVHSIKGGAGTFGFTLLQETTHLLENLLDEARRGGMPLSTNIINLFLEAKDIMQEQLDAYKASAEPDAESFQYICQALRQLALEAQSVPDTTALYPKEDPQGGESAAVGDRGQRRILLDALKEHERDLMLEELANLGSVSEVVKTATSVTATLETTVSEDDIIAVLCFVLEPEQIRFLSPGAAAEQIPFAITGESVAISSSAPLLPEIKSSYPECIEPQTARRVRDKSASRPQEANSIRVAVEKVDQLINLVGELVITQSMLAQRSGELDPVHYGELLASMGQLERNARDLQESVMSIRMMPMEYVFSRFPRQVRDLASKLNKQVELTLLGSSTELDKSLIERIIDPLTHLVRNGLDHGIETPEQRRAAGKRPSGHLILSAEH